jgi:hypothetical protein
MLFIGMIVTHTGPNVHWYDMCQSFDDSSSPIGMGFKHVSTLENTLKQSTGAPVLITDDRVYLHADPTHITILDYA